MNYEELEKDLPFETYEGACPTIRVNVLEALPQERYVLALKRLRKIVESSELDGYDCNFVGSKNNECNWGLCSQSKELWPDTQDYLWPHESDRVSPLRRKKKHQCPLDLRERPTFNGCFYTCHFFSKDWDMLTQKAVLAKIDAMIERWS